MRIADAAATIWQTGPRLVEDSACRYCWQDVERPAFVGPPVPHTTACPWRSMERIADFVEQAVGSMHRVWTKAGESGRGDWKEFAEMGDILYHATDGEMGACGRYDTPECGGEGES